HATVQKDATAAAEDFVRCRGGSRVTLRDELTCGLIESLVARVAERRVERQRWQPTPPRLQQVGLRARDDSLRRDRRRVMLERESYRLFQRNGPNTTSQLRLHRAGDRYQYQCEDRE